MNSRSRFIGTILALIFVSNLTACRDATSSAGLATEAVNPTLEIDLGQAHIAIQDVSLQQAYSTYYLMTFSGPENIFLVSELAITGVDDPQAWVENHLSLVGESGEYPLERFRPILTNDEVEYRADFEFEYIYELIYRIPRQTNFSQLWLAFDGQTAIDMLPFLQSTISSGLADLYATSEPAGTVLSGLDNLAYGEQSVVAGGSDNQALAINSVVCGGSYNLAAVSHAFVGGGRENRAELFYATVSGGYGNVASARETTVCGGSRNEASDRYATVAGGIRNQASSPESTIAGGSYNQASQVYAAVGGGTRNQAGGYGSFVGAGAGNEALSDYALVVGGLGNSASGEYSTLGGGHGNQAMGDYASVLGGTSNSAGADYSLALGSNIQIASRHTGAILISDADSTPFTSQAANELAVRATGGVRLVTSVDSDGIPTSGAILPSGSGAWSQLSDRAAKSNIALVDPQVVLDALLQLPLYTWRYNTQPESVRHLGPMAQDFYAAFQLGEDERFINSVDADGVALASVQALALQVEQQAEQLEQLEGQLADAQITTHQNENLLVVGLLGVILGWWMKSRSSHGTMPEKGNG